MTSSLNPRLPALNVGMKKKRQCQPMHVSGFMNARTATHCSNPSPVTAVFTVRMVMCHARRFNKTEAVANN